jgi:hypothetical protein
VRGLSFGLFVAEGQAMRLDLLDISSKNTAMLKRLSIVEDIFQITGRGLVVMPGVPCGGNWRVKIGDPIVLKRPDGSQVTTVIRGIEMGGRSRSRPMIPLVLGSELTKDAVPIGTEIWVDTPEDQEVHTSPPKH